MQDNLMLHHSDRILAAGKKRLHWGQYQLLTSSDAGKTTSSRKAL